MHFRQNERTNTLNDDKKKQLHWFAPRFRYFARLTPFQLSVGLGTGKKEATKNGDKTKCEENRDGPVLHFQLRLMLTGRWCGKMTYTWEMGTFAVLKAFKSVKRQKHWDTLGRTGSRRQLPGNLKPFCKTHAESQEHVAKKIEGKCLAHETRDRDLGQNS